MVEYESATPSELREVAKAFDGSKDIPTEPVDGMIIYNGPGTTRIFSVSDWSKEGVEVDSDTVWSRRNHWRLPRADFSDKQIAVLRRNGGFVIGKPIEDGE